MPTLPDPVGVLPGNLSLWGRGGEEACLAETWLAGWLPAPEAPCRPLHMSPHWLPPENGRTKERSWACALTKS